MQSFLILNISGVVQLASLVARPILCRMSIKFFLWVLFVWHMRANYGALTTRRDEHERGVATSPWYGSLPVGDDLELLGFRFPWIVPLSQRIRAEAP
jgi:hypothetical protein